MSNAERSVSCTFYEFPTSSKWLLFLLLTSWRGSASNTFWYHFHTWSTWLLFPSCRGKKLIFILSCNLLERLLATGIALWYKYHFLLPGLAHGQCKLLHQEMLWEQKGLCIHASCCKFTLENQNLVRRCLQGTFTRHVEVKFTPPSFQQLQWKPSVSVIWGVDIASIAARPICRRGAVKLSTQVHSMGCRALISSKQDSKLKQATSGMSVLLQWPLCCLITLHSCCYVMSSPAAWLTEPFVWKQRRFSGLEHQPCQIRPSQLISQEVMAQWF